METGGQPRSLGFKAHNLLLATTHRPPLQTSFMSSSLNSEPSFTSLGPSHSSLLALLEHSAWSPLISTPLPTPQPWSFLRVRLSPVQNRTLLQGRALWCSLSLNPSQPLARFFYFEFFFWGEPFIQKSAQIIHTQLMNLHESNTYM